MVGAGTVTEVWNSTLWVTSPEMRPYSDDRREAREPRGLSPAQRPQRSPHRRAGPMASPAFRRRARTCPGGSPMPMMAVAFPILPGKTAEWREFMDEVNGPRRDEFDASRKAAGVRERTFLQETPMGDLVLVTLEGDDPMASFAQMITAD